MLDLFKEIEKLKKERNAVILAHYYQEPDIQDIADYIGDSLGLAREAADTNADVILFAGVHFMAETAKILSPFKRVLLPDLDAGCSLADSCPPDKLAAFKEQHPDHVVVSYVNCSAGVKALSDLVCTSSNAEKIINSIDSDQKIIFAPDRNLGAYLNKVTGRDMLLWDGSCMVHEVFSEKKLLKLQFKHPEAKVLAHPECEERILRHADHIGSTAAILNFATQDDAKEYIVVTEAGIIHQMQKAAPDKTFIPAPPESSCACNECPHMRKNTLEKIYLALRDMQPEILMDDDLIERARMPITRMLSLS